MELRQRPFSRQTCACKGYVTCTAEYCQIITFDFGSECHFCYGVFPSYMTFEILKDIHCFSKPGNQSFKFLKFTMFFVITWNLSVYHLCASRPKMLRYFPTLNCNSKRTLSIFIASLISKYVTNSSGCTNTKSCTGIMRWYRYDIGSRCNVIGSCRWCPSDDCRCLTNWYHLHDVGWTSCDSWWCSVYSSSCGAKK